jgi:threonine dehydrogenase-like Zn-dependent dehydrogenase
MNDPKRAGALFAVLERNVRPGESVVAVLGDGPVWPVVACLMGAKKVFCFGDERELGLVKQFAEVNGVDVPGKLVLSDWKDVDSAIFGKEKVS